MCLCICVKSIYCLVLGRGLDRGCTNWVSCPKLKTGGEKEKGRKTNLWLLVYLDIGFFWLGRCFCSRRSRDVGRLLTFHQLVKKTREIFLSLELVTMITLDFYDDDYIPVGQRRGSCIFSLARGKSVYRLDVAMFVSLIVTWWRCPSTEHSRNLISPAA